MTQKFKVFVHRTAKLAVTAEQTELRTGEVELKRGFNTIKDASDYRDYIQSQIDAYNSVHGCASCEE